MINSVDQPDKQAQSQHSEEPNKGQHHEKLLQPDDVVLDAEIVESSAMENQNEGNSSLQGQSSASPRTAGDQISVHNVAEEASASSATMEAEEEEESRLEEDNVSERMNRHRVEAAGRVWIPEIWGQEELLKDWIDCSAFDAALVPSGIMPARAALVQEGRRANSGRFRIENRKCNDESDKNFFVTKK